MPLNKPYKYFYCKPCKFSWKTEDFHSDGEEVSALCPICEKNAPECTHSTYNLARTAWQNATGPKTEEGKARVALNPWVDGAHCKKIRILAPAKFDKFPWCHDCDQRDECEKKTIKYCPRDLETTARFIAAFKEGDVSALKEEAGIANAQMWKIFSMMLHNIVDKGVMLKIESTDSDGNKSVRYEKNNLVKELPAFVATLGFSADQQVMTPKAVEQKEALEGNVRREAVTQEEEIAVRKRSADELSRMRALLEQHQQAATLKKTLDDKSGE
jgi:hypothetical protein